VYQRASVANFLYNCRSAVLQSEILAHIPPPFSHITIPTPDPAAVSAALAHSGIWVGGRHYIPVPAGKYIKKEIKTNDALQCACNSMPMQPEIRVNQVNPCLKIHLHKKNHPRCLSSVFLREPQCQKILRIILINHICGYLRIIFNIDNTPQSCNHASVAIQPPVSASDTIITDKWRKIDGSGGA